MLFGFEFWAKVARPFFRSWIKVSLVGTSLYRPTYPTTQPRNEFLHLMCVHFFFSSDDPAHMPHSLHQVLALHLQFYSALILLHRPL